MEKHYKKQFILEGLDCANCANKIESKVNELPYVHEATVNFMMKMLTISFNDQYKMGEAIIEIKGIINVLEPHVKLKQYSEDLGHTDHHTHEHNIEDNKYELIKLIVGGILFVTPLLLELSEITKFVLYAVAYVIVGGDIILRAVKNILKGEIFDENFLMAIATVGAFAIGEFPEGVAVMLFYKIGELFQSMAVDKSRKSITELMDIRPDFAHLKVDNQFTKVDPEQVHIDDIVLVKPGEKVPLDGVIIKGQTMMDTSTLTGESIPRDLGVGSEVLSGFINQSGLVEIRVTKEFGESTVSKILELVQNASNRKAKAENFITKFARHYTPLVVVAAILIALVPPLLISDYTFGQWIYRALVFLVISCPCALVISIPLGFFGGIGAASRNGILIKGSNYLEALNNVETVVFDKTGTLTKGKFKVKDIKASHGFTKEELLKYAAYAESYSNHPIAISIIQEFNDNIDKERIKDYKEIAGYGIEVNVEEREVAVGNHKLMKLKELKYHNEDDIIGTIVHVAVDNIYAGCIIITDIIKDDAKFAIKKLRDVGVKETVMLTGDHQNVAQEVGDIVGVDKVYAQLLPHEKVEKLEQIYNEKSDDKNIVFVGDGINDAPVLARADIGIAMGGMGSDAAIEAADIVIMTDEPTKIVTAIRIAKTTRKIVWQNIVFALGVKIVVLLLGAFGLATMWEAVFADVGVSVIAILNAMRAMKAN